jgi:hypothetical protein
VIRQIAGFILLGMLCSSVARGQSSVEVGSVAPASHHLSKFPVLVWAGAVAADQITTYRFSIRYGDLMHEENPLIRDLSQHPTLLIAAGTAIDATTGWLAYRVFARHPRVGQIAFYAAAAYRGYLAAHNIQMMRLAEDIRRLSPPSIRPR